MASTALLALIVVAVASSSSDNATLPIEVRAPLAVALTGLSPAAFVGDVATAFETAALATLPALDRLENVAAAASADSARRRLGGDNITVINFDTVAYLEAVAASAAAAVAAHASATSLSLGAGVASGALLASVRGAAADISPSAADVYAAVAFDVPASLALIDNAEAATFAPASPPPPTPPPSLSRPRGDDDDDDDEVTEGLKSLLIIGAVLFLGLCCFPSFLRGKGRQVVAPMGVILPNNPNRI